MMRILLPLFSLMLLLSGCANSLISKRITYFEHPKFGEQRSSVRISSSYLPIKGFACLANGSFTYIKYNDIYIFSPNIDFFLPYKKVNDNYAFHIFSLFIPIVPRIPIPGFIFNSAGFEVSLQSTKPLHGYSIGIKNANDVVYYARNQNISRITLDHLERKTDRWEYFLAERSPLTMIKYGFREADLYVTHAIFNEENPNAILLEKDGVTTEFKLEHAWRPPVSCPAIPGMSP